MAKITITVDGSEKSKELVSIAIARMFSGMGCEVKMAEDLALHVDNTEIGPRQLSNEILSALDAGEELELCA